MSNKRYEDTLAYAFEQLRLRLAEFGQAFLATPVGRVVKWLIIGEPAEDEAERHE